MLVNPHDLNNIYQYKDPDMYRIRPELKLCMVKNFFFVKCYKQGCTSFHEVKAYMLFITELFFFRVTIQKCFYVIICKCIPLYRYL